jgi:hypothetical protein
MDTLYGKYVVQRTDGRDAPGGDRAGAQYFVLDLTHDPLARQVVLAYAAACEEESPLLARDLRNQVCKFQEEA